MEDVFREVGEGAANQVVDDEQSRQTTCWVVVVAVVEGSRELQCSSTHIRGTCGCFLFTGSLWKLFSAV